jgi:hypothetical protein
MVKLLGSKHSWRLLRHYYRIRVTHRHSGWPALRVCWIRMSLQTLLWKLIGKQSKHCISYGRQEIIPNMLIIRQYVMLTSDLRKRDTWIWFSSCCLYCEPTCSTPEKSNGSSTENSEATVEEKQEGERRIMKYWLILLQTDVTNPLVEALRC